MGNRRARQAIHTTRSEDFARCGTFCKATLTERTASVALGVPGPHRIPRAARQTAHGARAGRRLACLSPSTPRGA